MKTTAIEYYENYNAKGVIICQIKIFSRLFVILTRSNNRKKIAHISQLEKENVEKGTISAQKIFKCYLYLFRSTNQSCVRFQIFIQNSVDGNVDNYNILKPFHWTKRSEK